MPSTFNCNWDIKYWGTEPGVHLADIITEKVVLFFLHKFCFDI